MASRLCVLCCLIGCLEEPCTVDEASTAECASRGVPEGASAGASAGASTEALIRCPEGLPGELLINEVLPDPGGLDVNGDGEASAWDDEFVELVSVASTPRSFKGVQLVVGETVRLTLDDRCVAPGSALVVFGGGGVPLASSQRLFLVSRLSLANAGSVLTLLGPDGAPWDAVSWEGATPRQSLTREPDLVGPFQPHPRVPNSELRASPGWCTNLATLGSCDAPSGAHDDVPCQAVEYGELVVNELLADPAGLDINGDGYSDAKGDEFLELMVLSKGPRRLENVRVVVNDQERVVLNTGCLEPGQGVLIVGAAPAPPSLWGDPTFASERPLGLANVGATIELWSDIEVLDRHHYSEPGPRVTWRRQPDGTGPFGIGVPTPGECSVGGPLALSCERR